MKSRLSILAFVTTAAGALFSSCAYDPYYTASSTVGYNSNGQVSSSIFISTSNSRWGYDPHCHSYYDFTRQCYYDPYLCGYYPRGYRPPVLVGVPHPHGWHPGQRTCAPPTNVRNHNLTDYHNRYQNYRNLNQSWGNNVRTVSNSNGPSNPRTPSHSNSIWNRSGQTANSSNRNPSITRSTDPRTPSHSNSSWNRSSQNSNSSASNNSNRYDNRATSPTYTRSNSNSYEHRTNGNSNSQMRPDIGSPNRGTSSRNPSSFNRGNSTSSSGGSQFRNPDISRGSSYGRSSSAPTGHNSINAPSRNNSPQASLGSGRPPSARKSEPSLITENSNRNKNKP